MMTSIKEKIKDWFSITGIKISNFAKEHKYITTGIGMFLLSALVAIVVMATDDKISNAYVSINAFEVKTASQEQTVAPNFSVVTYTLKYKLGDSNCDTQSADVVDNVIITATLSDNYSYAKWNAAPEDVDYTIEGNVLTIDSPDNDFCKVNTQTFSLTVYNAASPDPNNPGSKIRPEIRLSSLTIKPGSSAPTHELINRADNDDKKVESPTITTDYDEGKAITGLTVEPIPGIALKKDSGTGRNAKFGLLLGFYPTESLRNALQNGMTGLEGSYIATTASDIYMKADETIGSSTTALDLSTNASDYGVYTSTIADKHFITDFPVLSTSGTAGELTRGVINSEESSEFVEAPSFSLAKKTLNYDVDPIEAENVIINGTEVACTTTNNCSYEIKEDGDNYKIEYTVSNGSNSTTLTQKINLPETPSEDSYLVYGPKTQYIVNKYKEFGLYDNEEDERVTDYNAEYYNSSNTKVADNDTEFNQNLSSGTYTVKYFVSETQVATRTVIVGSAEYSSIPVKVTSKSVTAEGTTYTGNDLIIGTNSIAMCTSSNHCTSEVTDSSSNPKKYKYTITLNDNGQKSILNKEIEEKPNYYKLPISNLLLSGNAYLADINGNSFYVLGSYFVTVPTSSVSSTINLHAFTEANETSAKTASILNKEKSTGTNSFKNDIYVMENESYTKVDSASKSGLAGDYYTASVGETIEVKTVYDYGADADTSMGSFKMLIDVNSAYLKPTARDEEATSNTPYYSATITRYGDQVDGLDPADKITVKYCNASGCNIDPASYYESLTEDITGIELTFNNSDNYLLPGTEIVIKTNYIVKNAETDITTQQFNSKAHVSYISSDSNISEEATSLTTYVTPYKTRINTFLGKGDELNKTDITLDVSKNDNYTAYAPISVTAPAMVLNSNIFGYDSINLPIKFILPRGVNYVYNAKYEIQPDDRNGVVHNSDGTTVLTYTYHGIEPNTWIDSIYFDFNVDVATPQNSVLIIVTQIGDFTTNNITNDLSSSTKFKTLTSSIKILNSERLAYGQYAYDKTGTQVVSSVDKSEPYIFDTKLYNNEEEPVTDAYVYTLLPSVEDNLSEYDGSYSINIPTTADASCTRELISASNKDSVTWEACSNFTGDVEDSGLKAVRIHYSSIAHGATAETKITITPEGNNPDNKYVFQTFLSYTGASSVLNFKNLTVTVISKKITGTVWEDFNDNGIMDDEEKKIENVTLKLFTKDGNEVDSTTPNKNGVYTFSGFEEGEYYIVAEFDTEKYGFTTPLKNYSDMSKVSVFSSDSTEVVNGSSSNTNSDALESLVNYTLRDDDEEYNSDDPEDPNDSENQGDSEDGDDEEQQSGTIDDSEEEEDNDIVVKTDIIVVTTDTRTINNINLGLSLRKKFQVKLSKYITSAEVVNNIGVVTKRDYGKAKLAKLDVRDINNLSIKVVYTIELENIKYYPGYIMEVNEIIPDGMAFNSNYSENAGWVENEDGTLSNYSLANDLLEEGAKRYLTVAFDITRKEAGSFINTASVDDLQILGGAEND